MMDDDDKPRPPVRVDDLALFLLQEISCGTTTATSSSTSPSEVSISRLSSSGRSQPSPQHPDDDIPAQQLSNRNMPSSGDKTEPSITLSEPPNYEERRSDDDDVLVERQQPGRINCFEQEAGDLQKSKISNCGGSTNRTSEYDIETGSVDRTLSCPGDVSVFPSFPSYPDLSIVTANDENTMNGIIVDVHALANATILDAETEENPPRRCRNMGFLAVFVIVTLSMLTVTVAVIFTRKTDLPQDTIRTISLAPSRVPSSLPTLVPTVPLSIVPAATMPSPDYYGFLSANSPDGGLGLSTSGSSQQQALSWIIAESGLSEMSYKMLQAYNLATFYYETSGSQWISTQELLKEEDVDDFDGVFKKKWLRFEKIKLLAPCFAPGLVCFAPGLV